MGVKVFKTTKTARSIEYQDTLLAPVVPNWPKVTVFLDDDRNSMFRPTRRSENDDVYVASLALIAESEADLTGVLGAAKIRGSSIHCVEEGITLDKSTKLNVAKKEWKAARRSGAALRGAEVSAKTRKSMTAEKLKLIEQDLKQNKFSTRELLDRVGIRSINTIKNHYLISREEMQLKYQAELKRKARRKNG